MISMLNAWSGNISINDCEISHLSDFKPVSGAIHIKLWPKAEKAVKSPATASKQPVTEDLSSTELKITVKQYMTRKSTPEFDFMERWNNDNPMPLRTMIGKKVKETRGMIYMSLHGQGLETVTCMRCGRPLTHPISRHYGIGPECMQKLGMICDITEVDQIKEKLTEVTWEGWIIKSAIQEVEEV